MIYCLARVAVVPVWRWHVYISTIHMSVCLCVPLHLYLWGPACHIMRGRFYCSSVWNRLSEVGLWFQSRFQGSVWSGAVETRKHLWTYDCPRKYRSTNVCLCVIQLADDTCLTFQPSRGVMWCCRRVTNTHSHVFASISVRTEWQDAFSDLLHHVYVCEATVASNTTEPFMVYSL